MTIKTFTRSNKLITEGQPVLVGVHLVDEMRAAGVPVIGSLWPMGVSSGALEVRYDDMFEEHVWTWRSE